MLLIIGVGWGYHVPLFLKSFPDYTLYFYEPIREVRSLLEKGRRQELENQGAHFISEVAAIRTKPEAKKYISLNIMPQYLRLFPNLESRIQDALNYSTGVEQETRNRFLSQWTRNFLIRLKETDNLTYITGFRNKLPAGTELLYCGAGPGLPADLEKIPGNKKHPGMFIIAADTAIAPLLALNLKPDLILSVDSGPGTAYHFAALPSGSHPLEIPVLSWSAGSRSLSHYFKRCYYYRSTLPFDQVAGSGPLESVPEWTNPARNPMGLALRLAAGLGLRQLYTAGADFKSPSYISHTRGTGYSRYAQGKQSRRSPLESYLPGGYGPGLSPKNQLTMEGLEEMSRELNVQILPLRESKSMSPSLPLPDGEPPNLMDCIQKQNISTKEIRSYLAQTWPRLNFQELAPNISERTIRKWHKLLVANS